VTASLRGGRWKFEKVGMGYRCSAEEIQTELRITHLKRSRGDLTGEVQILCNFVGVKTQDDGTLLRAKLNVTSSQARSSMVKVLEHRTSAAGHDMDWFDGLEALCQGVMTAEALSEPVLDVGTGPRREPGSNFLVEPLVLKNRPSLLFGPGGVGKSLVALGCGLSVAVGREIIPGVAPAAKGVVLYLDWEEDWDTLNDRIQKIGRGHDFKPGNMLYRRCRGPLAENVEELAGVVAERKVVMLVVDSAAHAMGTQGEYGDANESVLRMHEALRLIDTTSLIIDHVGNEAIRSKPGSARPYGSAYKTWAARMSWEARGGPMNGVQKINLIHHKSNSTRHLDPIGIELDWTEEMIRFRQATAIVETSPATTDGPLMTIKELILDYMSDGAKRTPLTVAKDLNLNASSVRVKMLDLAKESRLKGEDGLYWSDRIVDFRAPRSDG
jgi:hypothetical protein